MKFDLEKQVVCCRVELCTQFTVWLRLGLINLFSIETSPFPFYYLHDCRIRQKIGSLPVLQVLHRSETLESAVHHDGHSGAERLTFLHTDHTDTGRKYVNTYSTHHENVVDDTAILYFLVST